MPKKPVIEREYCKVCDGKGRVPSRLPFRDKMCEWCGGKGYVERKPTMAKKHARGRWSRR